MKWIKAVEQIEQALAAGKAVGVYYHRRWIKNDSHAGIVDSISRYMWNGEICYAVNTYNNQLNESSHIIDEVIIEERN